MLKKFFTQSFFKDSQAVALLAIGFLLLLFHGIDFALNIQSQEIKVPVRYSGYDESLSDKGHWLSLLTLVAFGITAFAVNTAIAIKVYFLRRSLAISLLMMNVVVMVFLVLVSRALLNLIGY